MGEGSQIFWIRFGGQQGFSNVMIQKEYFVFAAALLHQVDLVMLSMQKFKFTA